GASGARRVLQRRLGVVLRPLPAEEVLARPDPVLRLAGVPPDPLRDRRVPRAHVGQPAPGRRRSPAAPPPVIGAPRIARLVVAFAALAALILLGRQDRKSTRLNSSHVAISYAVFC